MVGRTVAHYQLTDKLGAGGMGEIYRAQDTRLSRTVAIKVLPDSHVADPDRRRRFLQEARAASALNHPNIITIHDVVFEGDTAFMVMEFVSGTTLADRIAAGPMSVSDVLTYAIQMADALAAAHDAGIIHRDLKPGNVMITGRGLVKILDFGLAKLSALSSSAGSADTTATVGAAPLTVEGSILGTVSYMSPEQAEGRPVDARSDIFSFGVMLYEMLTVSRPFTGESTLSILSSILRDDARPISVSMPAVPRPMDELVRRCIAKRPADRWQSMHELREALAALKADSNAQTVIAPASPRVARPFPTLAVAAVSAAFVVAIGVWFAVGHRKPGSAPSPVTTVPPPVSAPAEHVPAVPAPDAGILTNDGVLSMLRANVAPAVILQQIRNTPTKFDLSVKEVIRLTEAGASSDIIETMRNPKRPVTAAEKPKTVAPAQTGPTSSPQAAPAPAAASAPPPSAPAPAATVAVIVPDALPFRIELAEDVPADAEPGRPLHFTATKELRVGQAVVVPLHAPVLGEIVDGAKKKLIGGTKLTFRLKTVTAAGGALISLRVTPSGRDTHRPVETGSSPKPPKGLAAVIGTEYIAYTAGEQTVRIPK
jgi:serine/threonine-protein kinase